MDAKQLIDLLLSLGPDDVVEGERHGEKGVFFRFDLTAEEVILHGKVWDAWGDRDLGTRENVAKLVAEVARESGASAEAAAHVMQYIERCHLVANAGSTRRQ